jgi:sulfur carrier protein ThiS
MILRLGGHLSFYVPQKAPELEMQIPARTPLVDLLKRLHVPVDEIALVVINGEQVELKDAYISDQDRVQLFPPIGGGGGLFPF